VGRKTADVKTLQETFELLAGWRLNFTKSSSSKALPMTMACPPHLKAALMAAM